MDENKYRVTVNTVLEALIRHDYGAAQLALNVLQGSVSEEEAKWGPIRPGSAGYPTNEPIPEQLTKMYPTEYSIPGPSRVSDEGSGRLRIQETSDVLAQQQAHDREVLRQYNENHAEMMAELRKMREEAHVQALKPVFAQSTEVHSSPDPQFQEGQAREMREREKAERENRQRAENERKAQEKAERERLANEAKK